MRDLPYPKVLPEIDPRWRTSDVLGVARAIHAERAFDRLPLLCDALRDAGCAEDWVFDHFLGTERTCPRCDGKKGWDTSFAPYRWCPCDYCHETGKIRLGHGTGTRIWTHTNAACWERQCWLVNHLLHEPQPLQARSHWPRTFFRVDDDDVTATVVNPGDADGRTWLVYCEDCFQPPLFVVESASVTGAEDVLIDSEWGVNYRISEEDMEDYRNPDAVSDEWPYRCGSTDGGHAYDEEQFRIVGDEGRGMPFPCRYYGPGLPKNGVDPRLYAHLGHAGAACEECGNRYWPERAIYSPRGAYDRHYRFCSDACERAYERGANADADVFVSLSEAELFTS